MIDELYKDTLMFLENKKQKIMSRFLLKTSMIILFFSCFFTCGYYFSFFESYRFVWIIVLVVLQMKFITEIVYSQDYMDIKRDIKEIHIAYCSLFFLKHNLLDKNENYSYFVDYMLEKRKRYESK